MTSDSCFVVKQPHGYTIPTLQKEVIEVNPHSSGEPGANPFLKKKTPMNSLKMSCCSLPRQKKEAIVQRNKQTFS